mmetsp:Transcript_19157/g.40119  ORF Transcript_19157/g.40119 Transcript_19157/m.40119 type:complete len:89 (+) Transcript_19157:1418-1684(+)
MMRARHKEFMISLEKVQLESSVAKIKLQPTSLPSPETNVTTEKIEYFFICRGATAFDINVNVELSSAIMLEKTMAKLNMYCVAPKIPS